MESWVLVLLVAGHVIWGRVAPCPKPKCVHPSIKMKPLPLCCCYDTQRRQGLPRHTVNHADTSHRKALRYLKAGKREQEMLIQKLK